MREELVFPKINNENLESVKALIDTIAEIITIT